MAEKRKKGNYREWAVSFKQKNKNEKFFTRSFWILFLLLSLFPIGGILTGISAFLFYKEELPSLENLERIEPPLISKVYDKDSALIHEFFMERRIWINFKDIPLQLIQAIMAIEDRAFYRHWGVNLSAYPSAVLPVLLGKRVRGASTLTQQLAKNLFLTPERSIIRKIKELILAIKIEQTYTKEEILEFYINQVYLGAGAYGFKAASQKYYSRDLDSLSASEYALLAGLLQRPEAYRPDRHPDKARVRRNLVLRAMRDEGFLKKSELVKALTEDIQLDVWDEGALNAPYYVETIRQFLEKKWNEEFIYKKGVNIYSTLDSRIQEVARDAYQKNLKKIRLRIRYATARRLFMSRYLKMPIDALVRDWDSTYALFDSLFIHGKEEKWRRKHGYKEKFPDSLRYRHAQAAAIVLDNNNGAVRALIGGDNYETSKFNRAIQAVRSPGSSFKPIVYSAAVDNGGNPLDSINDQPITIPDPSDSTVVWRPKNYDGKFVGNVTLRRAFYKSKNLPAIKTAIKYGLSTVVSYARRFGLNHDIPAVPSIGIGSAKATLMEMVSAFSVFPNYGIRPEPYFIETLTGKDNRLIHKHIPHIHETLRKEVAFIILTILKDVNIRGTGARVRASGFDYPSGGKTGTTNDETDAWYIGFTKHYTTGIWVGTDDNKPLGRGHTGSADALPFWIDIMKEIHKGQRREDFAVPKGVARFRVCQISGQLAGHFCSPTSEDFFILNTQPSEICDGAHRIKRNMNSFGDAFGSRKKRMRTHGGSSDSTVERVHRVF